MSEIEDEYKNIFARNSEQDNEAFVPTDCGIDYSYTPITVEQIENELKSNKTSAPGLDRITTSLMRNMDTHLLAVLYNTILVSGIITDPLRK